MGSTEFILEYTPPAGFPKRKRRDTGTCALYTLKAVIETQSGENKNLKEYADGIRSYVSNFMTPRSLVSVLKKHGLKYKILKYRFVKKAERLRLLKEELLGGPIILSTANGLTKKKYFSWRKALMHWHYISLWGYDDSEECFYVYDSSCAMELDPTLKKGTIKIPYKYVLKYRNIGYYKIYSNFGIAVKY